MVDPGPILIPPGSPASDPEDRGQPRRSLIRAMAASVGGSPGSAAARSTAGSRPTSPTGLRNSSGGVKPRPDAGVCASLTEIAEAEGISKSYIGRILRLALLPPDVVEGIVEGRADQAPMLERLERPLPASWEAQRNLLR